MSSDVRLILDCREGLRQSVARVCDKMFSVARVYDKPSLGSATIAVFDLFLVVQAGFDVFDCICVHTHVMSQAQFNGKVSLIHRNLLNRGHCLRLHVERVMAESVRPTLLQDLLLSLSMSCAMHPFALYNADHS